MTSPPGARRGSVSDEELAAHYAPEALEQRAGGGSAVMSLTTAQFEIGRGLAAARAAAPGELLLALPPSELLYVSADSEARLGRNVAWYHRSSTSYQIHPHIRCLDL